MLFKEAISSLFPPTCLGCSELLEKTALLCSTCLTHMALINKDERCAYCFSEKERSFICPHCPKEPFDRLVFAVEDSPVSRALIHHLPTFVAMPKLLAAFLSLQFATLSWREADFFTIHPKGLLRRLIDGSDSNHLLAKECHFLPHKQILVQKETLRLQDEETLRGKTIVLLGTYYERGLHDPTIRLLRSACPHAVYGLFFSGRTANTIQ